MWGVRINLDSQPNCSLFTFEVRLHVHRVWFKPTKQHRCENAHNVLRHNACFSSALTHYCPLSQICPFSSLAIGQVFIFIFIYFMTGRNKAKVVLPSIIPLESLMACENQCLTTNCAAANKLMLHSQIKVILRSQWAGRWSYISTAPKWGFW